MGGADIETSLIGLGLTVFNHSSACYFVVIEPPSNLIATEVSSKYIKLSWTPSPSPVTGYKVLLTPMTTGSRQHALSVGPQTTMLSVRDLSADTEYQISVSAMKGLTASEPISIMEKTQPMKVQVGKLIGVSLGLEDVKVHLVVCLTVSNLGFFFHLIFHPSFIEI